MKSFIIKIAIVDDHLIVIDGVTKALQTQPNFKIIHTSTKGLNFLKELPQLNIDILLLDIQLSDIPGQQVAEKALQIRKDLKIIALTGFDSPGHVRSMLQAGCRGYILKNTERQALCDAIELVYKGDVFIEEQIKETYFKQLVPEHKRTDLDVILTDRDLHVLQLIYEEYTSSEIAQKLNLGIRTIEKNRLHLLQKLKVKNTAGLVRAAIEMGLIKRK